MGKYVECQNCQEQYDCERTYLGGCTDGKEWEEKPLLSKSDKEFYFALMTNCKKVIEKCPNIEERRLACEYCRFEQVRKKAVEEYEEFVKKANEEIESLKSKSSFKDSWKNEFFKAQEEVERLNLAVEGLTGVNKVLDKENAELIKQVDELTKPINGKFKDNNALQKAYESLEKEFTRRSQRLRELQSKETKAQVDLEIVRKQAVKDTAKEIYTQMLEWIPIGEDYSTFIDNFEMWLKERYGVEVE